MERLSLLIMDRRRLLVTAAFVVFTSLLLVKHACVDEDAYITFRYVDNLFSGHGLVFNVGERVQGYTHPLWLLLLIPAWLLRIDPFYWSVALGLVLNALMLVFFARRFFKTGNSHFVIVLFLLTIFSCVSFIDFQTSGLECSLNHFLLVMLVLAASTAAPNRLLRTAFWTGMLLTARLDLFFMSFPILLHVFFLETRPVRRRICLAFAGLLPIVAWEVFSIVYYGFVFPNTKYAKLGVLPLGRALEHAFAFIKDFVVWEPFPAAMILLAIVIVLWRGDRLGRVSMIGVLCYLSYLIMIGGGYMRGRLLLPCLLLAALSLARTARGSRIERSKEIIAIALLVIAGILSYVRAESSSGEIAATGIASVRKYYEHSNGLISRLRGARVHKLAAEGTLLRKQAAGGWIATRRNAVGMLGYYAGPDVLVIDNLGLTDAFIARTENLPPEQQRIGHPKHSIPSEYIDERLNGVIRHRWEDQDMYELWQRIKIITRGRILSLKRFTTMLQVWAEYGI